VASQKEEMNSIKNTDVSAVQETPLALSSSGGKSKPWARSGVFLTLAALGELNVRGS